MLSRSRVNLLLLTGVGLLAALAYGLRPPAPQPTSPWIDLGDQAPRRIEVLQDGELRIELLREADAWLLQQPYRRPADADRIDYLLGLVRARPTQVYTAEEVDLAGAGLAEAIWTLRLDRSLSIQLGATEALGQRRYARHGDDVVLLPDRWQPLLEAGAAAFADLRLSTLTTGLQAIVTPLASIALRDGSWVILAGEPGDAAAMARAWQDDQALAIRTLRERPENLGEVVLTGKGDRSQRFRVVEFADGLALQDIAAGYELLIGAEQADTLLRPPSAASTALD